MTRKVVYREEIDSTNTLAKTLADEGAANGTVVIAARQTGGRGRRGRTWLTLPGQHIYLSVILRPKLPVERASELTLTAAVALAEALERFGIAAGIKWPNDIEVEGKKLSGILCESAIDERGELRYVVLGVGVNVDTAASDFPDELRERATSVRAVTGREGLTEAIRTAFLDCLDAWITRDFESVLTAWRAHTTTLRSEVQATVDGQTITGMAEDIDSTGALLIRSGDGVLHRIGAGEVTTLRRA